MKLALALGSLVLVPWSSVRPHMRSAPAVQVSAAQAGARVLDARRLEVVRSDPNGESRSELTLADLPADARLHEVVAAPYMESGLVVGIVLAVEGGFEYRFLCQREGDAGGARDVFGTARELSQWWLSLPLFQGGGPAYRIVDVHHPGGDSIELTFRRGAIRVQGDHVELDEVVVVDTCPSGLSAQLGGWVHRIQVSGRRL